MLAQKGTIEDLKRKDMIFEPKLDGTRALIYKNENKITIINRRDFVLNFRYPELLEIEKNIKGNAVLDGEIIVLDKEGNVNFYQLAEREHVSDKFRIKLLSEVMPATFIVFDILWLDGKELIDKPLLERKEILK
jgi:bifunctional non-homologous end joining protein LigD/DNA ligase-1